MLIDTELQTITPFITHVQSDGSQIGGIDPVDYGATPVPGKRQSLLLRTSGNTDTAGKKYPAWLWSLHPRPILTTSGRFQMSYEFTFGGNLAGANVFETDTILIAMCSDGKVRKFNLSLQAHVGSGQIDVANASGGWSDTAIRAGGIAANMPHKVVIQYAYDTAKNTCSILSYTRDGQVWTIGAAFQGVPASLSTWAIGAIPQIQQGSFPSAQPWQAKISRLQYGWL